MIKLGFYKRRITLGSGRVERGDACEEGVGAPHLHFLFRKWNKHSAGSIVDASSTLVPSLQALHKDTLLKKKFKKKGTASSRFTVAKAMASCEPWGCLFIGAGLLSGSAPGWVKGAVKKDPEAHVYKPGSFKVGVKKKIMDWDEFAGVSGWKSVGIRWEWGH